MSEASIPSALGEAVRELRRQRGISQETLARRGGLHRTYIGGVERGERNPTVASLFKLANGLDVSPALLIRRIERALD